MKPSESLAKTLDNNRGIKRKPRKRPNYRNEGEQSEAGPSGESEENAEGRQKGNSTFYTDEPSTSTDNIAAEPDGVISYCSFVMQECKKFIIYLVLL